MNTPPPFLVEVMAFWCISGFMSWIYFAPFAGATLILMAKLFCRLLAKLQCFSSHRAGSAIVTSGSKRLQFLACGVVERGA